MACEGIRAQLASLIELRTETLQEGHDTHLTPAQAAQRLQTLKGLNAQIAATNVKLKECLNAPPPPPPPAKAPQSILEIQYTNPAPSVNTGDPNWAKNLAGGTFPTGSDKEWKQVFDPADEYDRTVAGASGWVVNPNASAHDFPFLHPLGGDWEFGLAPDSQYAPLLAPGNAAADGSDTQGIADATSLKIPIPNGLLGVEMDQECVPQSFQAQVHPGSRMAVFGRWIVDCGHDPFRTEIHPPLVMACANPQHDSQNNALTRVVFTSRPYLVGQTFTVSTDDIYNDQAADDGGFYPHIIREVVKVNEHRSLLVEAHPKIKSNPFLGITLAHFIIRPPTQGGLLGTTLAGHLSISFHFTVRKGCAVEVTSDGSAVNVFVAFNNVGYTPPPLPKRNGKRFSKDDLAAADGEIGTKFLEVEALSAAIQLLLPGSVLSAAAAVLILNRGIETDVYDPLPAINVLDPRNAVMNVSASAIPPNAGITHDDTQPFPFFGWLEAKFVPVTVSAASVS